MPDNKHSIIHTVTKTRYLLFVNFILCHLLFSCSYVNAEPTVSPDTTSIPVFSYKILNRYPHDHNAYTQGLIFEDGIMYEGTGLYGRSSLRKVDLETGKVLQFQKIPERFFGEGITIFEDKIIQLTWKSNIGFVYDKNSFILLDSFKYPTDGWGITHNDSHLIMSDGTSILHFLDPKSFEEIYQIKVTEGKRPIRKLNELEYINGEIFANVYETDTIVKIDPGNGAVTGWINLNGLLKKEELDITVNVMNGIAFDSINNRIFVTGKLWPYIFEIEMTGNK